jgi:isopentenyl diphosphate isomerase/L-lactate dehydrogenase-like FMN-dependent dehydrogenase
VREQPYNVDGFRAAARRRLPRAVFDFVDGGAGDEATLRRNRAAFGDYAFNASVLVDVHQRSLRTTVAGVAIDSPILLSPTGMAGLVHPEGERAAVTAAARRGTVAVASSASTYSIEELARAADLARTGSRPWFQLYPFGDHDFRRLVVDRVAAAGFEGLCFTVDCAVSGKRERDLAHRMTVRPLRITWSNALDFGRHPRWLGGVLARRRVTSRLTAAPDAAKPPLRSLVRSAGASAAAATSLLNPAVTWEDFKWLRDHWKGPLAIKGVLNPADALRAVSLGADAVIVSNHGGRQLDGLPAALDALPSVIAEVGTRADVILDGGVRRGADVVTALCLGARACMIGRPWLYGLAWGGTGGVEAVLGVLEAEVHTTLALLGQPDVSDLDPSYLIHRQAPHPQP